MAKYELSQCERQANMKEQITTYKPGMKSETDWERVRNLRDEDIVIDEDAPHVTDWSDAVLMYGDKAITLHAKSPITLRLDTDIITWFKSLGPRYQTRINAVLREVMEQSKP